MFIIQQYIPGPLNKGAMRKSLEDGLTEVSKLIQKDFESTVETWDTPAKFETVVNYRNDRLEVNVYTEDQRYIWINNGVEPHIIEAVNMDWMFFLENYVAKTREPLARTGTSFISSISGNESVSDSVGNIKSQIGGEWGNPVFAKEVNHPGIEPRIFNTRIRLGRTRDVESIMNKAMDGAARKSGHWLGPVGMRSSSPGTNLPVSVPFVSPGPVAYSPSVSVLNFRGNLNFVNR